MRRLPRPGLPVALLAAVVMALLSGRDAAARAQEEGWRITSFDASYAIQPDASVFATEDVRVDFGALQRHGIFRDIPVQYEYDADHNRLIRLTDIRVDDGSAPWKFEVIDNGTNLRIKIGDPDVLISGPQRYRISYTINGGLNPFPDHDEFYWNVTGNDWPVPIDQATAAVSIPSPGLRQVACYQGPAGSTLECGASSHDETSARFDNGPLSEFAGLTIVVGFQKGAVAVGPPELVDANETLLEEADGFLGIDPLPIAAAVAFFAGLIVLLVRQWWIAGRDRWYGDMFHVAGAASETARPLGAHETIVVEYTPPDVQALVRERRLRPAEVGLLVDERADTLDVTATIVDLAVRKHLLIKETEEGGVLGLFKKKDYELERLETPGDILLGYEQRLLDALFETGSPVRLSDLKNKFYEDLAQVKSDLYKEVTDELKVFPRNPDTTRTIYQVSGAVGVAIGAGAVFGLGTLAGIGVLGVPLVLAGVLLLLIAPAMPRRTAGGRVLYRRCLGFRKYVETAETERQRFAEKANLFEEYLPYAIVFECVDRWAKAFEGLGDEATRPSWYSGRSPFMASAFAASVNDFSESISSVMASTPGGRGGSGFGGGSSGGGGGGGGGGSW